MPATQHAGLENSTRIQRRRLQGITCWPDISGEVYLAPQKHQGNIIWGSPFSKFQGLTARISFSYCLVYHNIVGQPSCFLQATLCQTWTSIFAKGTTLGTWNPMVYKIVFTINNAMGLKPPGWDKLMLQVKQVKSHCWRLQPPHVLHEISISSPEMIISFPFSGLGGSYPLVI